jgi:hypothetical protein
MKKGITFLILIFVLGIISCSDDSSIENHLLVGNYIGSWDTKQDIELKLSIEPYNDNSGLVLFFTLADSFDLNIISDKEFSIDPFVQYGFSNNISGIIVEDTLYMQNEIYLVSDQMNTENLRTGRFVKQ